MTRPNPTGLVIIETDILSLLYSRAIAPITGSWVERIIYITNQVRYEIEQWAPEALAWEIAPDVKHLDEETGQLRSNPDTLMKLSHIGGAMIGLCAAAGLACQPVYPQQAKNALTGNKLATKANMIQAAKTIFAQQLVKDIADACGVALAGESLLRQLRLAA